jgi:DNA-binding NarL/FixJ family response regulator
MSVAPVCLIGGNEAARGKLREILETGSFDVVSEYDNVHACVAAVDEMAEPELVVSMVHAADEFRDGRLGQLRRTFPEANLVIIGDNPTQGQLRAVVELDANGFLPSSIDPRALLQSLQVILLGEKLYIAGRKRAIKAVATGTVATGQGSAAASSERRGSARRRTLQQAEIVYNNNQCVMNGAIFDISDQGAKIRPADIVNAPSRFELRVKYGPSFKCEVVRKSGFYIGVRFLAEVDSAA